MSIYEKEPRLRGPMSAAPEGLHSLGKATRGIEHKDTPEQEMAQRATVTHFRRNRNYKSDLNLRERSSLLAAEGATAPETLRHKDRLFFNTLKSGAQAPAHGESRKRIAPLR